MDHSIKVVDPNMSTYGVPYKQCTNEFCSAQKYFSCTKKCINAQMCFCCNNIFLGAQFNSYVSAQTLSQCTEIICQCTKVDSVVTNIIFLVTNFSCAFCSNHFDHFTQPNLLKLPTYEQFESQTREGLAIVKKLFCAEVRIADETHYF